MARTDARKFTNLMLIAVMVLVAVVGISLQMRSIGSRAKKPPVEVIAPAPEPESEQPTPSSSEESAPPTTIATGNDLSSALWRIIIYGALIVAAIILGARILKRYGGERLKQTSSPEIRILGRRYINPKQSIAMVKVRHKELLLGITDHSIRLLYDFTPDEEKGNGTEFA
ncbi:MAG: flagellar biosynthetic protein FliO [Candidatus Neomarinimicrobiota bacterium]